MPVSQQSARCSVHSNTLRAWVLAALLDKAAAQACCGSKTHAEPQLYAAHLGVKDLHRVQAPRNLHERRIQKVALKLLSLQRGAHDHQLQIIAVL